MGTVAAAGYAALGLALAAAGLALRRAETMSPVPLYDESTATDPAALARVLGAALVAFGAATLAFAALEAVERTGVVVVAGYGVVVLTVALVTAARTRHYE
ncbi:hypothetical protein [Halobacterium yunchengense]|uniref:hypothetical protein n=1 Tax=Halobacterium yunchengense TaxID=3108497 RepID=UPI00300BF4EE